MTTSDGFEIVQMGSDAEGTTVSIAFDPPGKAKARITLQVELGKAMEDFSQTGQVIWPAAPIMAYFLLSEHGRLLTRGKDVVELGAGVGIPGLLACRSARSVVLTDHNPAVLDILRRNIALNASTRRGTSPSCSGTAECGAAAVGGCWGTCSVAALDWSTPPPAALAGRFQVICRPLRMTNLAQYSTIFFVQ